MFLLLFFIHYSLGLECFSDSTQYGVGYGSTHVTHLHRGGVVQFSCRSAPDPIVEFLGIEKTPTWLTVKGNTTTRSFIYRVPIENESASRENGKKISCKRKNLTCNIQLNVRFDPFFDNSVPKNLTFDENVDATIECPIRAPNFPPYDYMILWTVDNKVNFQVFFLLLNLF